MIYKAIKIAILALILAVIVLGMIGARNARDEFETNPNTRYSVTIGNWVGAKTKHCHHYERDGSTYRLFFENGEIAGEVTAGPGYYVTVKREH